MNTIHQELQELCLQNFHNNSGRQILPMGEDTQLLPKKLGNWPFGSKLQEKVLSYPAYT